MLLGSGLHYIIMTLLHWFVSLYQLVHMLHVLLWHPSGNRYHTDICNSKYCNVHFNFVNRYLLRMRKSIEHVFSCVAEVFVLVISAS